jgi:regulator of protease activity HflC (stomatin/prohibitin superfamily)
MKKALAIVGAVIAALAFVFAGIPAAIGAMVAWNSADAGHIVVVRNGGAFSDSNIRQIIDPASGLTWSGVWSTVHKYPSQQRFYTIAASGGDRPGVDISVNQSSDGVDMGIEGTLYFKLNTDHAAISAFDNAYGTRTYTEDGQSLHAYDGDTGWAIFLDQIFRPVLDNDLRQQISQFSCAQLVSSCALVQDPTQTAAAKTGVSNTANNGNLAKVQKAINDSLAADLRSALGGDYFTGLRFNISRISLPDKVQSAVNDAQAAYAKVSQAQAEVASAQAQAAANQAKQQGYVNCPACAVIDELKAIPGNVTTFAPGAGFAITPKP